MSEPFIRPYDPARDFNAALDVYTATVDANIDREPIRTIGSYLWFRPYVHLDAATCFVLDDGAGRAVGYCIGTADTGAFAQRWRDDFVPSVDAAHVPRPEIQAHTLDPVMHDDPDALHFRKAVYNAECSMLQRFPHVLETYPAHLHIDLLAEYRGKGWGRGLIETFFRAVKALGARGVHLDMVRTNVGAKRFYDKMGFRVCPWVLDEGKSGEEGVNGVVMTLVRDL